MMKEIEAVDFMELPKNTKLVNSEARIWFHVVSKGQAHDCNHYWL